MSKQTVQNSATISKPSLYQTVTDRILASLKAGSIPWEKPWQAPTYTGGSFSPATSGPASLPQRQRHAALVYSLLGTLLAHRQTGTEHETRLNRTSRTTPTTGRN